MCLGPDLSPLSGSLLGMIKISQSITEMTLPTGTLGSKMIG